MTVSNVAAACRELGYDDRPTGLWPTELPPNTVLLKPGTKIEAGDIGYAGRHGWVSVCAGANIIGRRIVTTVYVRPLSVRPSIWYCKGPACKSRENDKGHCCYWCGAKETT